jgi:hypothetical protein
MNLIFKKLNLILIVNKIKEAVREAYEKAGSTDKIFKIFGNEEPDLHWGHCDLICGKRAPDITWPYMLNWMDERI